MQPKGYGAAIYIFGLQARIASSPPRFLLLRYFEALLFCRLVSVFIQKKDNEKTKENLCSSPPYLLTDFPLTPFLVCTIPTHPLPL